jgi:hypothetical protein
MILSPVLSSALAGPEAAPFGGDTPFFPTAALALDFARGKFRQTRTRTNLLLWSQDFSNAAWRKSAGDNVAADSVVAPDGTLTADAYTWATSTTDFGYLSQRIAGVNASGTFTYSVWARVPSGTKSFAIQISDLSVTTKSSGTFTLTTAWQRLAFTVTAGQLTNTGTLAVGHMGLNPGDVVHLWGAQIEANPAASAYISTGAAAASVTENVVGLVDPTAADLGGLYGWSFARTGSGLADNTSGTYTSFASNVPRITDKGLLVEEARTNVVTNSAGNGAVVGVIGSGGAWPAGWSITNPVGGTVQIVSVQTKADGLTYVRFKATGTNGGSQTTFRVGFLGSAVQAATSGQTWTTSAVVNVFDVTGVSSPAFETAGMSSGGATVESANSGGSLTVGSLGRLTATRALNNASTVSVQPRFNFNINASTTYSIDVEVAIPQLEQAAFATSPIVTTGASATRGPDGTALRHGMSATDGTLFIRYRPLASSVQSPRRYLFNVIDSGNNRFSLRLADAAGNQPLFAYGTGAAVGMLSAAADQTIGATNKVAIAWSSTAATGQALSLNGALVKDTSAGAAPDFTTNVMAFLANVDGAGNNAGSVVIERIVYYPRRLTDAELQALTQ